jgi:hypothetical protein
VKSSYLILILFSSSVFAQRAPRTQERLPREVTVTAIPGVIADGARWQHVWEGTNNADGIAGTPDGGLLFAQVSCFQCQTSSVKRRMSNEFVKRPNDPMTQDPNGIGSVGQLVV